MNDIKPKLMGGIGEINFGKQYIQFGEDTSKYRVVRNEN